MSNRKTRGSVEKASTLSNVKVVLGTGVIDNIFEAGEIAAAPSEPAASANIVDMATRNEIDQQLLQRDRRIAELSAELDRINALGLETEDALSDCRQRLQEMHESLDAAKAEAERNGYESGIANAESLLREEWAQQAQQWLLSTRELARQFEQWCKDWQRQSGEIALATTAKIIGEQLAEPEKIAAALRHIVRESGIAGPLKILLAPAHYAQLLQCGDMSLLLGCVVELAADERITHGGCMLQSSTVLVDARYDMQLKKLRDIVSLHSDAGAAA